MLLKLKRNNIRQNFESSGWRKTTKEKITSEKQREKKLVEYNIKNIWSNIKRSKKYICGTPDIFGYGKGNGKYKILILTP